VRRPNGRSTTDILRDWLDGKPPEDREALAQITAEFMLQKALEPDFGFFKLVIELIDGRVDLKSERDAMVAPGCTIILANYRQHPETVNAA
jgi:hypothetical protein